MSIHTCAGPLTLWVDGQDIHTIGPATARFKMRLNGTAARVSPGDFTTIEAQVFDKHGQVYTQVTVKLKDPATGAWDPQTRALALTFPLQLTVGGVVPISVTAQLTTAAGPWAFDPPDGDSRTVSGKPLDAQGRATLAGRQRLQQAAVNGQALITLEAQFTPSP